MKNGFEPTENIKELAQVGYKAYGATTDFKNYAGLPMPDWDALPPKIQQAWYSSTKAILVKYTSDLENRVFPTV